MSDHHGGGGDAVALANGAPRLARRLGPPSTASPSAEVPASTGRGFDRDQPTYLYLLYLARVIHHRSQAAMLPTIAHEGLSDTQWWALLLIDAGRTCTAAELARELDHDSGALTRVLDQLVSRGLARRDRVPNDRRTARLSTTSMGGALVQRCLSDLGVRWSERGQGRREGELQRDLDGLKAIASLLGVLLRDEEASAR